MVDSDCQTAWYKAVQAAGDRIPVDLAAVRADDAMLNMLSGNRPTCNQVDAELMRNLCAWRRMVDDEPVGELVSVAAAVAAIDAGRSLTVDPQQWPMLVLAFASVLVIGLGLLGLLTSGDLLSFMRELPGDIVRLISHLYQWW